jgi:hypothetical protein
MNLFVIGMILILSGWIVQIYRISIKKKNDFSLNFLVLYGLGCAFLCIGNYLNKDMIMGMLNTLSVILAILVIIILTKKK